MAKRATSKPAASGAKPAPASRASGARPTASTASQVSTSNPLDAGVSAAAAESNSQGSDSTAQQPQGGLTSSPVVQPRRPLWPVQPAQDEVTQILKDAIAWLDGKRQDEDQVSAPSVVSDEAATSLSAESSAASTPDFVMPGNYRTLAGSYTGGEKRRYHTPQPPDIGVH